MRLLQINEAIDLLNKEVCVDGITGYIITCVNVRRASDNTFSHYIEFEVGFMNDGKPQQAVVEAFRVRVLT